MAAATERDKVEKQPAQTPTPEAPRRSPASAPIANPYAQLTTPGSPAAESATPKPDKESSTARPLAGAASPTTALAGQSTQPATQPVATPTATPQASQPAAQPTAQPVAQPAAQPTVGAAMPGPGPGGGTRQPEQPQPVENPYSTLTDSTAAAHTQNTYNPEQVSPHVTGPDASRADRPGLQDAPPPPPGQADSMAVASGAGTPQVTGAIADQMASRYGTPPPAQTASGFINFDQLYGANSGVAKRESDKRANDAMMSAKKAQGELSALQQQYTKQVNSGTLQGPNESDQGWAQYGDGVQEAPIRPAPGTEILQPSNADIAGEVNAGANSAGYSGPNALSALDAYGQLTQDTTAARQGIGALQSNEGLQGLGMNQTDAALLGGAGRSQFAKLGDQYGGLQKDLDSANDASIGQANDARSQSDAARDAYRGLLDQRGATDQAAADKAKADAEAVQNAIGGAGGLDPLGKGVEYPSFMHTTKNSDGEVVWDDAATPDYWAHMLGADSSYDTAKDPSKGLAQKLSEWFKIPNEDTDWAVGSMTQKDYQDFQAAAHRGPDAMKKWIDDLLKRRTT